MLTKDLQYARDNNLYKLLLDKEEGCSLEALRRHLVQSLLPGQTLGAVHQGDHQLGGTSHGIALRHALDELFIVGQIAHQQSDHHLVGFFLLFDL